MHWNWYLVTQIALSMKSSNNLAIDSNWNILVLASQITGVSMVCSGICSGADQRKHQSSVSLAFVRGIQRWPVNYPHKRPIMRKMFRFDDTIMIWHLWAIMIFNVVWDGPYCTNSPSMVQLLHWMRVSFASASWVLRPYGHMFLLDTNLFCQQF